MKPQINTDEHRKARKREQKIQEKNLIKGVRKEEVSY